MTTNNNKCVVLRSWIKAQIIRPWFSIRLSGKILTNKFHKSLNALEKYPPPAAKVNTKSVNFQLLSVWGVNEKPKKSCNWKKKNQKFTSSVLETDGKPCNPPTCSSAQGIFPAIIFTELFHISWNLVLIWSIFLQHSSRPPLQKFQKEFTALLRHLEERLCWPQLEGQHLWGGQTSKWEETTEE